MLRMTDLSSFLPSEKHLSVLPSAFSAYLQHNNLVDPSAQAEAALPALSCLLPPSSLQKTSGHPHQEDTSSPGILLLDFV